MLRSLPLVLLFGCAFRPPGDEIVKPVPLVAQDGCFPQREDVVECVVDGDTYDLGACGEGIGERIRLLGVNAPEIEHPGEPAECYGPEAAAEAERLLAGQTVWVSFDKDPHCIDIYGRTLAYIWLAEDSLEPFLGEHDIDAWLDDDPGLDDVEGPALMVNEYLLGAGWARLYPEERFGEVAFQLRLTAAEATGRTQSKGLWSACE